ncbi:12417_t:CDS:2, partial [Gigaspora rosea]
MNSSELFLYRCKLFFKAPNEGKISFFYLMYQMLHSNGHPFFPEYIRATPHSIHGEYSWNQKDTNKTIKLIVEALSLPNHLDNGRSNFVLTNGKGIFVVVETKVISSNNFFFSRDEKLHDVKRQATEYKTMFLEHFADDSAVIGACLQMKPIRFSSEIDEAVEP